MTTLENSFTLPEVSISITDPDSSTTEIYEIDNYGDLYLINNLLDTLEEFNENLFKGLSGNQEPTLDNLKFNIPIFDDFCKEFPKENLILSFPNDTVNSIMLPLSYLLENPRIVTMFLEDSRHIINEAFKRSIINSNIIFRFVQPNNYFYLKVSMKMGNLKIEPVSSVSTNEVLFSFQTNLKYPETFNFSTVESISNIDETRFEPFHLTNVSLIKEPQPILGEDKIYRLFFKGFLDRNL